MSMDALYKSAAADQSLREPYSDIVFPDPPANRPYTFINMVSTLDGKILLGPPGSTAKGIGSPTDQLMMRRLQGQADAAIVGANTLRAGNVVYPSHLWRAVVTRSGNLDLTNRFFTDAPGKAIVFAPIGIADNIKDLLSARTIVRPTGENTVNTVESARILRQEFAVKVLALEGGGNLNFDFLNNGLVDEFFLTLAPKLKGGDHSPTAVGGQGLPGFGHIPAELLSIYRDGSELYLRYKLEPVNYNHAQE